MTGTTELIVTPSATTTYTLTASDGSTSVERQVIAAIGPPRPNLVIFLVDDMGITDTSEPFAYGSSGQLESFCLLYTSPSPRD